MQNLLILQLRDLNRKIKTSSRTCIIHMEYEQLSMWYDFRGNDSASRHLYQLYLLKPKNVPFKPQAANTFQLKHQFWLVSSHCLKHCVKTDSEESASHSAVKSVMINQQWLLWKWEESVVAQVPSFCHHGTRHALPWFKGSELQLLVV